MQTSNYSEKHFNQLKSLCCVVIWQMLEQVICKYLLCLIKLFGMELMEQWWNKFRLDWCVALLLCCLISLFHLNCFISQNIANHLKALNRDIIFRALDSMLANDIREVNIADKKWIFILFYLLSQMKLNVKTLIKESIIQALIVRPFDVNHQNVDFHTKDKSFRLVWTGVRVFERFLT